MVNGSMCPGYNPKSSPIYKSIIRHLLAINPNFQGDIQVVGWAD